MLREVWISGGVTGDKREITQPERIMEAQWVLGCSGRCEFLAELLGISEK